MTWLQSALCCVSGNDTQVSTLPHSVLISRVTGHEAFYRISICPISAVSSGDRRNTGVKFTRGSLEA